MRFSESKKGGLISKLQLTNDLLLEFRIEAKYGGYTASMELFQKDSDIDESAFDKMQVIIQSMTRKEREKPEIINPQRKRRIAAGSGTKVEDVNRLLNQYRQMQKLFKQVNGKDTRRRMRRMMRGMQ